eukprot:7466429-Alexandrium_andersonii.AAC.1
MQVEGGARGAAVQARRHQRAVEAARPDLREQGQVHEAQREGSNGRIHQTGAQNCGLGDC